MIGVIADDFTGATDVAVAFRRAGLRTVVVFDTSADTALVDADVAVVALKTRTAAASVAVAQSLSALSWLRERGAEQIFVKYCSTFDSRADGNIGPVVDAVAATLGASRAAFVPASPRHGRTQYMGHLFVNGVLLSESPMRHHPLTPMTNSHLPTVLASQTSRAVALIDFAVVSRGAAELSATLSDAQREAPYVLIDAVSDADLDTIGQACLDDVLVTGAAGLAGGLGAAYARRHGAGPVGKDLTAASTGGGGGGGVVLAGSCSARTLEQIEAMRHRNHPHLQLDAVTTPDADMLAQQALQWFDRQAPASGPLIYASLAPEQLRHTQAALGAERSAAVIDAAMGLIARGVVERGIGRLVVAGGETSGAVVQALQIAEATIGAEAAPGVPWMYTVGGRPLAILLKSGNFGDPALLADAVAGAR